MQMKCLVLVVRFGAFQWVTAKKIKKIPSSDRQAFRQTCGFYPAIWPGDLAM
jgi:hypothetical protein